MTFNNFLLASVLPLALLSACGGQSDDDPSKDTATAGDGDGDGDGDTLSSSEGKEESCDSYCKGLSTCEGISTETCRKSCIEGEGVSRGGQEVLAECIDSDLCSGEVSDIDGLVALACLSKGLEDIPLSKAASSYCNTSVETINDCLGESTEEFELGSCEDTIALASDEYLEAMNECASEDCDDMEFCITRELLLVLPVKELSDLEEDDDVPASLIADLLAVGVVIGQLGVGEQFSDVIDDGFGELLEGGDSATPNEDTSGLGGASSR